MGVFKEATEHMKEHEYGDTQVFQCPDGILIVVKGIRIEMIAGGTVIPLKTPLNIEEA